MNTMNTDRHGSAVLKQRNYPWESVRSVFVFFFWRFDFGSGLDPGVIQRDPGAKKPRRWVLKKTRKTEDLGF
jgi:hypothetical protein